MVYPKGTPNSKFKYKCFDVNPKRYVELYYIGVVGSAYELYQSLHRNQNKNIQSIANILQFSWTLAGEVSDSEALALSWFLGEQYVMPARDTFFTKIIDGVSGKVGLDLYKDAGLKLTTFSEAAMDILGYGTDTSWVAMEAEGKMEFIAVPEQN